MSKLISNVNVFCCNKGNDHKAFVIFCTCVIIFFLFVPATLFAQAMVNLKMLNLKNNELFSLGDFERGKVWVERGSKNVLVYNGDTIKSYSIREDVFLPVRELNFENDNLTIKKWDKEEEEKEKKAETKAKQKLVPKFLWNLSLRDINFSLATTDVKGASLFIADKNGDIHVFDIADREYKGRLRFLRKPIKYLKTLENGGMLIIYEGSIVYYVESFKIPIFSFLQDLKSSYRVKNYVKLPLNFISSFAINTGEDKAVLAGDHKTVLTLDLPSLKYNRVSEERLFIEFADFVDDDALVYMILKVKSLSENTTTIRSHFTFMENYFDLRKTAIISPSGSFLMRISDKESLDIYDLITPSMLGRVAIEQKRLGEIFFGNDNRTIIIVDKKKERLTFYKLIEQNAN